MILLHRACFEMQQQQQQEEFLLQCLNDLPRSIQTKPAVVASKIALVNNNKSNNNDDDAMKKAIASQLAKPKDKQAKVNRGRLYLNLGMYQDAADVFDDILANNNNDDDFETKVAAWNVLAQSRVNPERAKALVDEYLHKNKIEEDDDDDDDDDEADAQALEDKGIPRFGSSTSSSLSSSYSRGLQDRGREKELKKQAMLERRERKKKAYIKKLQQDGNHNKQPDPERWIPKNQRSTSRRRRGVAVGRGAQGHATSEKQAAKLDVAARVQNPSASSKAFSTAHMDVSGGGGGVRRGGKRR